MDKIKAKKICDDINQQLKDMPTYDPRRRELRIKFHQYARLAGYNTHGAALKACDMASYKLYL